LALVVYENLLPGTQLVNRLQDMGYRVQALAEVGRLVEQAQQEKPLLVMVDLATRETEFCAAISALKKDPATAHIPILAFVDHKNTSLQAAAREAGATLVASDAAVLAQLPRLLEQVLQVE
jgi:CheY-like chemotaxis protein